MPSLGPIQHLAERLGELSVAVLFEMLLKSIDCGAKILPNMLIVFPDEVD